MLAEEARTPRSPSPRRSGSVGRLLSLLVPVALLACGFGAACEDEARWLRDVPAGPRGCVGGEDAAACRLIRSEEDLFANGTVDESVTYTYDAAGNMLSQESARCDYGFVYWR